MSIFNADQKTLLQNLSQGLSREELIWTSGYLYGLAQEHEKNGAREVFLKEHSGDPALSLGEPGKDLPAPVTLRPISKISIIYGTETGNSRQIALQLATAAKREKIQAKIIASDQYKPSDIINEEYLFIIISTHGDGEPPSAARALYEYLHSSSLGNISHIKYGVLALGDKAYPLFCKAGADIDDCLAKAGAKRLLERQDCDVDYTTNVNIWITKTIEILKKGEEIPSVNNALTIKQKKIRSTARITYNGKVKINVTLNDQGSNKETRHIEIISPIPVEYEPGDSIGIVPENGISEVNEILQILGTSGSQFLQFKGKTTTLFQALRSKLNLRKQSQVALKKYAELELLPEIKEELELPELLRKYPPLKSRQNHSAFLEVLDNNTPRLYSIASSPNAHEGEVHITVARNYFEKNNRKRPGLCSDYLSSLGAYQSVDFYVQPNLIFGLPENPDTDIIMVGPGTGIAPFRSFLAERDATNATGRNWLFFGDQHQHTDFLYQAEWQNYLETGLLTKLTVAFSRDTDHKVYVQHRLEENGKEVFAWLEKGAYFYICGTRDPMSKDVEETLLQIISHEGNMNRQQAEDYLHKLRESERYLKDVY